jgi:hypothetical protein
MALLLLVMQAVWMVLLSVVAWQCRVVPSALAAQPEAE